MDKDPKSITRMAITSAKTKAIIDTGRAAGKSEDEIAHEALGGEKGIREAAFNMQFVLTMRAMCAALGVPPDEINTSNAFTGYAAIMQHYPDHPAAVDFDQLYRDDVTIGEVWKYVLTCLDKDISVLYTSGKYDAEWFTNLLAKKMSDSDMRFGFSKKHAQEIRLLLYPGEAANCSET